MRNIKKQRNLLSLTLTSTVDNIFFLGGGGALIFRAGGGPVMSILNFRIRIRSKTHQPCL
jgi:hypothetical protein